MPIFDDEQSSDSEFSDGFDGRLDEEFNQMIKKMKKKGGTSKDTSATMTKRFSRSPTFMQWVERPDEVKGTTRAGPKQQNLFETESTKTRASSKPSTENEKRYSRSPTFLRYDAVG
ncbi:hypothetical protein HA402_015325 [Bradysia odoriphaga]|nr:hypothetical protein HA402_015325 [Bradysia odoriphaga]